MKETFIKDMKEIIKESNIDELLNHNPDLRKRYCKYILKKDINFFEKTATKNGFLELKKVYNQDNFSLNENILKDEESKLIKKYLLYSNLKNVDPETLEKLNQANTIMTSIKENDFEADLMYDGKSRQDVINLIKTYDKDFYNAYTKMNKLVNNKVKYELNMIKIYDEYLKFKEERK